jgi:AcrR family transcriptional regulator
MARTPSRAAPLSARDLTQIGKSTPRLPLRASVARSGRPRDPGLERRVFNASIKLYAAVGWTGFNFDRVAANARVGKAALYQRFKTRGNLLRATLEARWYGVIMVDHGSLREDLLEIATQSFDLFVGPHGKVALQLFLDTQRHTEVLASVGKYEEQLVLQSRAIAVRAIARGEIQPSLNPGLIVDAVIGAVTLHVYATPRRLRSAMIKNSRHFINDLVQLVLKGAQT